MLCAILTLMKQVLVILQIVLSLALIGLILMQPRGTGLGRGGGGGGTSFTRRGLEKLIFKLTFIIAAGFIIVAVLSLLL